MELNKLKNVEAFLSVCDTCHGDVYFMSPWGDRFNLKSKLSHYIDFDKVIEEGKNDLEVFCEYKDDERKVLGFLEETNSI